MDRHNTIDAEGLLLGVARTIGNDAKPDPVPKRRKRSLPSQNAIQGRQQGDKSEAYSLNEIAHVCHTSTFHHSILTPVRFLVALNGALGVSTVVVRSGIDTILSSGLDKSNTHRQHFSVCR